MSIKKTQPRCFLLPAIKTTLDKKSIVEKRLFQSRPDFSPIPITLPLNWRAEAWGGDKNSRMLLQGWSMFRPIIPFFDDWEDKPGIIAYFTEVVQDWAAQHISKAPDDMSEFAWYDMSVGLRALVLAFFMERIAYFGIPIAPETQKLLDELAAFHIAHLEKPENFRPTNHGIFQAHGLAGLARMRNDRQAAAVADSLMASLFDSQFTAKGIHNEHSPGYHFFAERMFSDIALSGWYGGDFISERMAAINRAGDFLRDERGSPACVGDTDPCLGNSETIAKRAVAGALAYEKSDFDASGYSILRSINAAPDNSSYFFLTGMYFSKIHKHRDCLSFLLRERGQAIFIDSGKYGYIKDAMKNYFKSSRAHNVLEIEGIETLDRDPEGSCIGDSRFENGIYSASGTIHFKKHGARWQRNIEYIPKQSLRIKDVAASDTKRKFTQWFHLGEDFNVWIENGNVFAKNNGGITLAFHCRRKKFSPPPAVSFAKGRDGDITQGWVSHAHGARTPCPAIGFSRYGKKCEIDMTVRIYSE